jgi:hypothetical protein
VRLHDLPLGTTVNKQDIIQATLPNGSIITSLGSVHIPIQNSTVRLHAHVFADNVLQTTLLSISALCNQGYTATFTATSVTVTDDDGTIILRGTKLPIDKLWPIHIPMKNTHACAHLAIRNSSDAEYVTFVHATFGSPPVSTLSKAVHNGWLGNFPRITPKMISSNPPQSVATAKDT